MMTAKTAREMTEKAIEKEIATKKERAEQFCEEVVKDITRACETRRSELTVQDIPSGLYSYVIGVFKDNGYSVTQLNNKTIVLNW